MPQVGDPEYLYDAYLAYSSHDHDQIASIDAELRALGYRTFFDRTNMDPDQTVTEQLARRIGASECMVVFGTPGPVGDYLRREVALALDGVHRTRVISTLLPGAGLADLHRINPLLATRSAIDLDGMSPRDIAARLSIAIRDAPVVVSPSRAPEPPASSRGARNRLLVMGITALAAVVAVVGLVLMLSPGGNDGEDDDLASAVEPTAEPAASVEDAEIFGNTAPVQAATPMPTATATETPTESPAPAASDPVNGLPPLEPCDDAPAAGVPLREPAATFDDHEDDEGVIEVPFVERFEITGTAAYAGCVHHLEVALSRSGAASQVYWNAPAERWQERFVVFPIAVEQVGGGNATWSYSKVLPAGEYRFRAFARGYDGIGENDNNVVTFVVTDADSPSEEVEAGQAQVDAAMPDPRPPSGSARTRIEFPVNGSLLAPNFSIRATAEHQSGAEEIKELVLAITRVVDDAWWNFDTGDWSSEAFWLKTDGTAIVRTLTFEPGDYVATAESETTGGVRATRSNSFAVFTPVS